MSTVEEIEAAVRDLPAEARRSFRTWYEEFDSNAWDREIEEDVQSGKLNKVAERAIEDLEAGRCTEL